MAEMPRNLDAERALLASLAFDSSRLYDARELVAPEDFYHPKHRILFGALVRLVVRREPIQISTLSQALRDSGEFEEVGGSSFVVDLLGEGFTAETVDHDARIVRDLSRRRRLISTCLGLAHAAGEPIDDPRAFFDDAERQVLRVTGDRIADDADDMASAVDEAEALTEEAASAVEGVIGVPTGLRTLDHVLRGLRRRHLVIAAGRPGGGKTALGGCIAAHAACRAGIPTAFFSLEMSRAEIAQRMRSLLSGVSGSRLDRGFLSDDDRRALDQANAMLRSAPMRITDRPGMTAFEIAAAARRYRSALGGLGLIVVDYVQKMGVRSRANSTREQDVSELSRGLKALAQELEVPVLALAQLNRDVEKRPDGQPRLSDLRESGALEQDADVVLLIHREELTKPTPANAGHAEIIVAKHRNGETGKVKLRYDGARCRFYEEGSP